MVRTTKQCLFTSISRIALSLTLFSFYNSSEAADWPQWRGPDRNGTWNEKDIVKKFAAPQLSIRWRTKISNGYSGPTVAKGRVYITDRITSPDPKERILCFDAKTGKPIWSYSYECKYKKVGYPNGPRAAVAINDNRTYSLGTMGHLFCLDAATGDFLWKKDCVTEYKIKMPIWGITASPLVEGDLVIAQIGGRDGACLVAFDKVTGSERWRALDDRASYSAPIMIEQAGKRVLVCWTGDSVTGLNPVTGELYWQYPFKPFRMVINVPTPVFHDDYLFVTSFYDGSLLLKVNPDKLTVEKVWRRKGTSEKETDSLHCMISTPVLQGDYIYGVDSYGQLRCLELRTGDRIWESFDAVPKNRWANIHMVKNQDNIWMFNESGELIISKLSPRGFHEISRAKLIKPTKGQLNRGVCWSHPAFADKHVYIRNDEELVCANLSDED
ncbi:MAG: PQQ-binding-like beta-propeller repeat protein [Planctomycetes bacterium]|nr:PQQ-binding-like beta-propeller repeat protein [Planctomycetota bacterium]